MASGGVIKMQAAGKIDFARYRELARRLVSDGSFSPEELKELEQIQNSNEFDNALAIEADLDFSRRLRLANSESLSDINPALPRVESSAPTPVFDATVEVPSLNQAPAADIIPVYNDFIYGEGAASRPTYDSAAPQMSVPPKTDSMPQGPRPSTTGGTQVNIAGNIYAVLDDGSVIDQTGRTPPPPVAELARTKAVSMAREPAPSLNQAPAADAAIYGGGVADGVTYDSAAPSGLAALSPDTMPTVDGPFAYPESRFSTNLGPRAMLDWEEGQAEEAALIDARTNADLGSGRTPRYDTAIGPQPTSPQTETPIDLEAYLKSIYPDYGQEDARTNADLGSGRTPRYDTAIGPQPAPPAPPAAPPAPSLEEVMDQFGVNRADAQAIIDRTYTPRINGEGSPFAVNENAPTGTRDAYSMIFGPLPAPYFNSELTAAEKRAAYEKEKARREEETAAFAAAETPASVTPNIDNITDEELAKYTNKRPQPRPKDLFAPTTDNAREGGATTTGTGTGSGSGSGSGGSSNYETKLLEMLSRQEANAKSDKWMALAQAGMSLMQGGTGSFGGDLGRAGQTGLAALQGSRASNDKSQLDILGAIENSKLKREAIAASAAKSTAPNATALKSVIENLDIEMAPLAARAATGKLTPDEKTQLDELKKQRNYYVNILGGLAGGGNGAYPASPTPKPPYDATKPPGIIGRGINAVRDAITG
jgi:hypothetical protein